MLILPAFGIATGGRLLLTGKKCVFGNNGMIYASLAITTLGLLV